MCDTLFCLAAWLQTFSRQGRRARIRVQVRSADVFFSCAAKRATRTPARRAAGVAIQTLRSSRAVDKRSLSLSLSLSLPLSVCVWVQPQCLTTCVVGSVTEHSPIAGLRAGGRETATASFARLGRSYGAACASRRPRSAQSVPLPTSSLPLSVSSRSSSESSSSSSDRSQIDAIAIARAIVL